MGRGLGDVILKVGEQALIERFSGNYKIQRLPPDFWTRHSSQSIYLSICSSVQLIAFFRSKAILKVNSLRSKILFFKFFDNFLYNFMMNYPIHLIFEMIPRTTMYINISEASL